MLGTGNLIDCVCSPPTPATHSKQRKVGWKVLGNFYHTEADFRLHLCPVSQSWISCGTPFAKDESRVFLQWQSAKPWFAHANCEPLQLQRSVLESRAVQWKPWALLSKVAAFMHQPPGNYLTICGLTGVGDFIQTQQLDLIWKPVNKNSVGWRKVQASSLSALPSSNTGNAQLLLRMGPRYQRGILKVTQCGDH